MTTSSMYHSKDNGGRQSFSNLFFTAAFAFSISIAVMSGALATPRPIEQPISNPDLTKACGLNVLMILDESGSIGSSHATQDVRNAFKAFTDAIKNTSSAMAVAEFSKVARLPVIGSFQPGEYITVTDSTKVALDAYIDNNYNPNGNTNWEDGLRMGIPNFAPRNNFQVPHLTVFITDGDPNQIIRSDNVTAAEYANKVPLADSETTGVSENTAADHAVANANNLKAQGSHVLTIAVGSGLSSTSSLNRLIKVSGPDVYDGVGDFDISTDDIYREPDFSKLKDALRKAAFQLCSPSVTVQKLIDRTPDPGTTDDAVPGAGWVIEGAVTAPGGYAWVLPVAESPGTGPKSTNTDSTGFATFQWLSNAAGASNFTAIETIQSGFTNAQNETQCTYRTPDEPNDQLLTITPGNGSFNASIPQESIVTCRFVNIATPAPAITLKKFTNGADANTSPGPNIPVGKPVNWTYVVTNTGNTTLRNIALTDAEEVPSQASGPTVSCPKTTLTQGESMTCTATGTSGTRASSVSFTGQYRNRATVTAVDSYSTPVTASDLSHYVAAAPGIQIEKATNGQDADNAPGPLVTPGSPVTWSYVVTNTGSETINSINVVDDHAGTVTCPQATLAPGASMTCTDKIGTAITGQYENRATVTGIPVISEGTVTDEDLSHYFGVVAALTVKKFTNGVDADVPPGPAIAIGQAVYWTYVVTNTGNIPLASWTVSDSDPKAKITCPSVVLVPSASATCVAKGIALTGQYANVATASAPNPLGGPNITASDPSHYFGAQPALILEKTTNGEDADDPPGPFIAVGQPITWSYKVTNTGNTPLTDLLVVDSELGAVPCNNTSLATGESTTCSLSGVATAGQYLNLSLALAYGTNSEIVGALDPSHYFGATPGIHLEKLTNGVDADTAPGPYILEGNPVEWSYEVTNTGNTQLTGITLTDDQLGPITCPQAALDPQASMICIASGIAVSGQYANSATVTANTTSAPVSDTDPSHYFGYISAIHVEKATNGQDADDPIGPIVPTGSTVTWTYRVSNPGDVALKDVTLADDQGVVPVFQSGDANNDGLLDPGETWLYQAQGIAVSGQYANIATATAVDKFENPVQDTDSSHYYGLVLEPSIDIEKATNGVDADSLPGPRIRVGETAQFTYVVTNTGNTFLTNVRVTDDQGLVVTCPSGNPIPVLEPRSQETCTASEVVTEGQRVNIGTATGNSPDGRTPRDSDPSHYVGIPPIALEVGIDIEKATNGEDADTPPGPTLQVGSTVNFTYVITNTGKVPLSDVKVTDDKGVTVSCSSGNSKIPILRAGSRETCTGSAKVSPGQYTNYGSVTGKAPDGSLYSDSDPSHHFGGSGGEPRGIPTISILGLGLLALLLGSSAFLGLQMSAKGGRD
ncbi:MAG TPA: VWA domain-containing protein [Candidatus Competibacter sp.]|nr:DUF11 domain-containing protein [Candidatus Competibacter sp.]HRX59665.1 VWA domain-containing protein [Candidatus Competibacter sp.]